MNTKTPFAARVQFFLVILMFCSIVMLSQRTWLPLYKAGLILMAITSLSQIAFGNILPSADLGRSMRQYAIYMAIIGAIFAISILITPWLVSLGR